MFRLQSPHEELKIDEDVQEAALASERYALLNAVKVGAINETNKEKDLRILKVGVN